ncbi:hypothetical protein F511_33230 [Dorcoceras hygrometricum]|uniref:Uncharacterized protein n=1 Tax=Dorcoceras hygrometricum TaxID=472368 RepID=A0A2Z7BIZ8_9LAMI|nr:hypothetical protein F511_33230 [Dorcoceras hygrometricum]
MQYLNLAMHEQGYQKSSVRRLSRPSQGTVVFRRNDSAGHHININVGPFRRDDLAGRSQRVKGFSFQKHYSALERSLKREGIAYQKLLKNRRTTGSQSIRPTNSNLNSNSLVLKPRSSLSYLNSTEHYSALERSLKREGIAYQKLLKNRRTTGSQSIRPTNTATTSGSSIPATLVSKLVSIESLREDELSATNLAPNSDEKRRQSTEIGSGEQ